MRCGWRRCLFALLLLIIACRTLLSPQMADRQGEARWPSSQRSAASGPQMTQRQQAPTAPRAYTEPAAVPAPAAAQREIGGAAGNASLLGALPPTATSADAEAALRRAWARGQLSAADNRSAAAEYLRRYHGVTLRPALPPAPAEPPAGETWPQVSVLVPTCLDRHTRHANLLAMFKAQDYPGPMELLVADGLCQKRHKCARNLPSVSALAALNNSHLHRASRHGSAVRRVRYWADTAFEHLGAKRNWLVRQAAGSVLAHFDDDDYYAPSYLSTMVGTMLRQQSTTRPQLLKLRSWFTYGEKFETDPWKRVPITQWESQSGLGWGFSYVYRREYALAYPFSEGRDAAEERDFLAGVEPPAAGGAHACAARLIRTTAS